MSDREAFEKTFAVPSDAFYNADINGYCWRTHPFSEHPFDATYEGWCAGKQAAQAQAGDPIAAVHGWFHGECVIRALDPEAVLPAGMALYSQPQAQAGDGGAFCDANCTWLDHHKDCAVLPLVWMRSEDVRRTMIAIEGERAEVSPDKENGFDVPLYTAPPAAVNQHLPEGYVLVPVDPTEAMIDAVVAVAFSASVHGKGGWNNYMKALYRAFIAAAQEQK